MLLKGLLRISSLHHGPSNFTLRGCYVHTSKVVAKKRITDPQFKRNVDLVKHKDDTETHGPYSFLQNLNISTKGQVHSLSLTSDKVIKLIKMGFINKNLAVQYCHYVCELARTMTDSNDSSHYCKQSLTTLLYLLNNNSSLTNDSLLTLIADVTSTNKENCVAICEYLLQKPEMISNFSQRIFTKLLTSCYMYKEWMLATSIISYDINIFQLDPMVEAFISSAERYKKMNWNQEEKELSRTQVITHLLTFLEECFKHRIQFITKHQDRFIEALEMFDIKVVKKPNINGYGRCHHCSTILPLYDKDSVFESNAKIKELLYKNIKSQTIYVNAKLKELEAFERYLDESYKEDNRHFDVVIDGLNVAYRSVMGVYYVQQELDHDVTRTIKRHNQGTQAQVLISCIKKSYFLKQSKKILVIGRQHMRNWPGLLEFFDKENIYFFFPDNVSKDDLHQLYAATLSPDTSFMTCDLFRDHLAHMEFSDRTALERWIDTHQIWVHAKTLNLTYATPYQKLSSVNRKNKQSIHFHVPLIDFYKLDALSSNQPPPHLNDQMLTWICCTVSSSK